jgi:hypothetical protein
MRGTAQLNRRRKCGAKGRNLNRGPLHKSNPHQIKSQIKFEESTHSLTWRVKYGRTNFRWPTTICVLIFHCEFYSLEVLWRCEKKLAKTQTNILKPQTRSSSLLAREAEENKSMAGHKKKTGVTKRQKENT